MCAWCWLHAWGGGLGILGSWVQIPLGCWINIRWGWVCLTSFWGRQNECQLADILCRSGDLSRIVPNSQGNCLGSTKALHSVRSQWMNGWMVNVLEDNMTCSWLSTRQGHQSMRMKIPTQNSCFVPFKICVQVRTSDVFDCWHILSLVELVCMTSSEFTHLPYHNLLVRGGWDTVF